MNAITRWAATHRKALVAAFGVAVTLAAGVWGTGNKWVALAVLIATVLGVNQVPNQAATTPAEPAPYPPPPAPGPHRPSAPLAGDGTPGPEPKD